MNERYIVTLRNKLTSVIRIRFLKLILKKVRVTIVEQKRLMFLLHDAHTIYQIKTIFINTYVPIMYASYMYLCMHILGNLIFLTMKNQK